MLAAGGSPLKPSNRPCYQRHYTPADIELLAAVDEAHESLSGPATRHILKREFEVYGKSEFERLAKLSNGHLYNLRRTPRYGLRQLRKDTAHGGLDRRTAQARAQRPTRLSAHRHRASGRRPGGQGNLPHQRRRRGHAMGSSAGNSPHFRGLADALAGKHPPAVPLHHPQLPLR